MDADRRKESQRRKKAEEQARRKKEVRARGLVQLFQVWWWVIDYVAWLSSQGEEKGTAFVPWA